ncbi:MAG: C39 family peptidase [Oscillospiraceae bacterium]|nr:C39 family peptidase [Oscillospiraceae bacterium]MBQ7130583.1 C39 family peptidase [Oscillospiraceae bacterium]
MKLFRVFTCLFLAVFLAFGCISPAYAAVSPEEDVVEAEEIPVWQQVPQYFQDDYPDEPYGNSTIAKGGCSVTSLAMVATYLTGHAYLPDELAYYFGGRAENNIRRLELGSEVLRLPYDRAENWRQVMQALRDGKIAVVLMNHTSIFTDTQHFIVLTGLNEEGRIMINDPYKPNYKKWDLKKALVAGFDEGSVLKGYSGGWIYDKEQMPDDPFIYTENVPRFENRGMEQEESDRPRYPDVIELSPVEQDLLARAVCAEAAGGDGECRQAIAELIFNRMVSSAYPDDLEGVLSDTRQFAADSKAARPSAADYAAIEKALEGPYLLEQGVVRFSQTPLMAEEYAQIGGFHFCYDE